MQWYKTHFKYLSFLICIKKNNLIYTPSIFTSVDGLLSCLLFFYIFIMEIIANIRNKNSLLGWRKPREKSDFEVCFCCLQTPRNLTVVTPQFLSFLCNRSRWMWIGIIRGSNAIPARLNCGVLFSEHTIFLGWDEMILARMTSQTVLQRRVKGRSLGCLMSLKRLYMVLQPAGY